MPSQCRCSGFHCPCTVMCKRLPTASKQAHAYQTLCCNHAEECACLTQAVTAALTFFGRSLIRAWSHASIFHVCEAVESHALVAACILSSAVGSTVAVGSIAVGSSGQQWAALQWAAVGSSEQQWAAVGSTAVGSTVVLGTRLHKSTENTTGAAPAAGGSSTPLPCSASLSWVAHPPCLAPFPALIAPAHTRWCSCCPQTASDSALQYAIRCQSLIVVPPIGLWRSHDCWLLHADTVGCHQRCTAR